METVTDLATAIGEHADAGERLDFRGGYQFSFASLHEPVRQSWGADLSAGDGFELVAIDAGHWAGPLVGADMVDEVTVSFAGPAIRPPDHTPCSRTASPTGAPPSSTGPTPQ